MNIDISMLHDLIPTMDYIDDYFKNEIAAFNDREDPASIDLNRSLKAAIFAHKRTYKILLKIQETLTS